MPLDPPALSTPATDPDPSTPPPPEPHAETVWRRTFLAQFSSPADREALERFGDLLYAVTLGAGYLGDRKCLFADDELDAVADEIDELAATLREISEGPDQCEVGEENLDLCREARDWEGRLSDLAHEIRCRVREAEGRPALGTDRPLAADIREADRNRRPGCRPNRRSPPRPRSAVDLPAARGARRVEAGGAVVDRADPGAPPR